MAAIHGSAAIYDGVSNSTWKYTGGGSCFEERDPNLRDVVNFNLNQTYYGLGLYKMVRGRLSATGTQTFHRASVDFAEINSLAIPQQGYITMWFPEQNLSMTGWCDGVQIDDHLQGDLVTITISLYVYTGWLPRLTNESEPIPPEPPKPSS